MSTVRLRRLTADSAKLQNYVRRHPRVRLIQMDGDPPERYQLEYRIQSLRMVGSDLQTVQTHLVEVALPRNYPRTPPQCRMLSPVFHPNIAPHAICVGDHWGAGESLESIVIRIGEMLAYQSYNVKSPLNGEAARWVEQNKHRIPLDPVSLLPEDDSRDHSENVTSDDRQKVVTPSSMPNDEPSRQIMKDSRPEQTSTSESAVKPVSPSVIVRCPECSAKYRVSSDWLGRNVRCTKCGKSFSCSADELQ
jgi:predicted Zn finger-like uncharacterized protein